MAENKYGITDPREIFGYVACNAIHWNRHGTLDKILYVADYIEPRRNRAPSVLTGDEKSITDLDETTRLAKGIPGIFKRTGAYRRKWPESLWRYAMCVIRADWKRLPLRFGRTLRGNTGSMTAGARHKNRRKSTGRQKGEDIRIIMISVMYRSWQTILVS